MSSLRLRSASLFPMLIAGASASLGACSSDSAGPVPAEVRSEKAHVTAPVVGVDDLATLSTDDRHFAWDLYQAVRAMPGNLAFSPASLSLSLAMAYGGARGTTATQMATTLHFTLPNQRLHPAFDALALALTIPLVGADSLGVLLSNGVWTQRGVALEHDYLDLLAQYYGAGVHLVDFAQEPETARLTINQWVSEQTHAAIPALLGPGTIDPLTALVLTNAVYFHLDWKTPFSPMSATGTFQTLAGPVQVPMMQAQDGARGWSGAGYEAASLDYAAVSGWSMVVIVPNAGTFDAFEAGLTFDALETILTPSASSQVLVSMPRFSLDTRLALGRTLAGMGMPDAFSSSDADFSGIDGHRHLFIKDVVHEALVAVDEKGTTATASTAVTFQRKSDTFGSPPMIVDRPFLFAIRNVATGTILFLGRVLDPSKR